MRFISDPNWFEKANFSGMICFTLIVTLSPAHHGRIKFRYVYLYRRFTSGHNKLEHTVTLWTILILKGTKF